MRGWRNTVGNLVGFVWLEKPIAGAKHRGVPATETTTNTHTNQHITSNNANKHDNDDNITPIQGHALLSNTNTLI